jgi:hypothetical protein
MTPSWIGRSRSANKSSKAGSAGVAVGSAAVELVVACMSVLVDTLDREKLRRVWTGKRDRDNESLGTADLNEPELDKLFVGAGLVATARVGETARVVLTTLELPPDDALDFLQLIGLLLPLLDAAGLLETTGTGGFATRPLIAETSSSATCLGAICRGEVGFDVLPLEGVFVARGLFCQDRFGT